MSGITGSGKKEKSQFMNVRTTEQWFSRNTTLGRKGEKVSYITKRTALCWVSQGSLFPAACIMSSRAWLALRD